MAGLVLEWLDEAIAVLMLAAVVDVSFGMLYQWHDTWDFWGQISLRLVVLMLLSAGAEAFL